MKIEHSVFNVRGVNVLKATYKDAVYYIADNNDITEYVNRVQVAHKYNDIELTLSRSVDLFYKENPHFNKLKVPLFDFILRDDPKTSVDFVNIICEDIFHFNVNQCNKVVNDLNTIGTAYIGTFTSEMCDTFGAMIENGNNQMNKNNSNFKQNLVWDKVPVQHNESVVVSQLVHNLIKRDYPED